jgi:hypothetical protein
MNRAFSIFVHVGLFVSVLLGLAFVAGGVVVLNRADKISFVGLGLAMVALGAWGCVSAVRQTLAVHQ